MLLLLGIALVFSFGTDGDSSFRHYVLLLNSCIAVHADFPNHCSFLSTGKVEEIIRADASFSLVAQRTFPGLLFLSCHLGDDGMDEPLNINTRRPTT